MITLKNFEKTMTEKAKKSGICENFGQKEIMQLRERYGYNPYGNEKERRVANEIDRLSNWAANFSLNDIK